MYELEINYKEKGIHLVHKRAANIKIKFMFYDNSNFTDTINRINYKKSFINEMPTIKEYLEKNENFHQDENYKKLFYKKFRDAKIAELTIKKPFFQFPFPGIGFHIYASEKISLEEILDWQKLYSFIEKGAFIKK